MADGDQHVTLDTLHGDIVALRGEMRAGFADLKVTMITGFAGLPTRESSEEMIRILRESNRIHESRLSQVDGRVGQVDQRVAEANERIAQVDERIALVDLRIREQQAEAQQSLQALRESQQALSAEIGALIRRIDALIRRRNDGGGSA